ncbi:MAG: helix-turn-helix domain-containing protein [Oscillospiraceae bacterium]|nr:helix-turn-helix domain-containing protein [Oscillospiraceae bacterium]
MRTKLINARNEKKLTVSQASTLLGISERQYCYIEAGGRDTNSDNWLKLFEMFDKTVPLDQLMANTPKSNTT